MITNSRFPGWWSRRRGGLQPLSVVVPEVLRQYGLELPPEAARSAPSETTPGGGATSPRPCSTRVGRER
jgi:hypothetical protein